MKQLRKLFLITAIVLVSKGFCQDCCFEFSGEWLYMLSAIDQPYFAVNKGAAPNADIINLFDGDRIANSQEWHSGYRVEAAYAFRCSNQVVARWTQFHNFSDSKSDNEPLLGIFTLPTLGLDLTNATMRDEFDLYYLDVLYAKTFYCRDALTLAIDIGVQFAHIDLDEEIFYSSAVLPDAQLLENQSSLRGIGPELGIDFKYALFSCLEIKGQANAGVLISKKKSKNKNIDAGTLLAFSENETYWLGTPSADFRLGLGFDYSFSCGCFNLEAGYEIIHFVKGVDRIFLTNVSTFPPGASFTEQMDLTLHGPYVHLGFCF